MCKNAFENHNEYKCTISVIDSIVNMEINYSNELLDLTENILCPINIQDPEYSSELKIAYLEKKLEQQKNMYELEISKLLEKNKSIVDLQTQKQIIEEQYLFNINKLKEFELKLKNKEEELAQKELELTEKFKLEDKKRELEQKEQELKQTEKLLQGKLNNNHLPKVCEKSECIHLIREMYRKAPTETFIKDKIDKFLSDNSEYVVCGGPTSDILITNKGKVLRKLRRYDSPHSMVWSWDLETDFMNDFLLKVIIRDSAFTRDCTGYEQDPVLTQMRIKHVSFN